MMDQRSSAAGESFVILQERIRKFARERDWEQYHTPKNLSMAVIVEAAELVEHFQWLSAEQSESLSSEKLEEISEELADVLIYLIGLADRLNIDLLAAANRKLIINEKKYPAERVRGKSNKYSDYIS